MRGEAGGGGRVRLVGVRGGELVEDFEKGFGFFNRILGEVEGMRRRLGD